jgi:hypothetical protein
MVLKLEMVSIEIAKLSTIFGGSYGNNGIQLIIIHSTKQWKKNTPVWRGEECLYRLS